MTNIGKTVFIFSIYYLGTIKLGHIVLKTDFHFKKKNDKKSSSNVKAVAMTGSAAMQPDSAVVTEATNKILLEKFRQ